MVVVFRVLLDRLSGLRKRLGIVDPLVAVKVRYRIMRAVAMPGLFLFQPQDRPETDIVGRDHGHSKDPDGTSTSSMPVFSWITSVA